MKTKYDDLSPEQQAEIDELLNEQSSAPERFYSFDDTGNAHRFADTYGGIFRYSHVDKSWLYWDKTRWKYDDDGAVFRAVNASVESMKKELARLIIPSAPTAKSTFINSRKPSFSPRARTPNSKRARR